VIVGDYAKAAREIVETLARLATIETDLRALNARLPAYTGDIQIEAFPGHGATLGQTVVLPPTTSEDAAFWPTRPRRQTINEVYARSRRRYVDSGLWRNAQIADMSGRRPVVKGLFEAAVNVSGAVMSSAC
jgi:hypothetical protein